MSGSFPYGQKAKELLNELKRSDWLPPYNDAAVRQIIEEINALYKEARHLSPQTEENGKDPVIICPWVVYHHSAMRNKRCLLAYLQHRLEVVLELRWQVGSIIPADLKAKLSESELHLFSEYDKILAEYMQAIDMDLTGDIKPPKELMIEVRVLKDCGEVLTESGPVVLQKNTYHFLRRTDIEHLIRQNFVEHVDS